MKKIVALFLFFSSFFNAQILEKFPTKQDFYKGGESACYKRINDIWTENNFQPKLRDRKKTLNSSLKS